MIKHIALIYYCIQKFWFSIGRPKTVASDVAGYMVMIIVSLWVMYLVLYISVVTEVDIFTELMEKTYLKYTSLVVWVVLILGVKRIINKKFEELLSFYDSIENWNTSWYRMRGLIYILFHFILFPILAFIFLFQVG